MTKKMRTSKCELAKLNAFPTPEKDAPDERMKVSNGKLPLPGKEGCKVKQPHLELEDLVAQLPKAKVPGEAAKMTNGKPTRQKKLAAR